MDLRSLTRDQTHSPCIGKWSFAKEDPLIGFFWVFTINGYLSLHIGRRLGEFETPLKPIPVEALCDFEGDQVSPCPGVPGAPGRLGPDWPLLHSLKGLRDDREET